MWRVLIVILLLANVAAFAAVRGMFGPPPAASELQPSRLSDQYAPQSLVVLPVGPQSAENTVVVGKPDPIEPTQSTVLPK